MAPGHQKKMATPEILLKDLNPCITCSLCSGYLIDATSLIDCLHVFCRACILRYFENFKLGCPTCNVVYKKKSNPIFRPDPIIQSLVYKLVPGLYSKEVQRREDFYRSTGVRASSSCSEDSVLGDLNEEREEWMLSSCGEQSQYLCPDDAISLSLEYYQPHLDTTQNPPSNTKSTNSEDSTSEEKQSDINNSANSSAEKTQHCDNSNINASAGKESVELKLERPKQISSGTDENLKDKVKSENGDDLLYRRKGDRRYLQCPAAVTMSHLQKFLRMKYALNTEHRVDIIYSGEVLPTYFSLMDVAYTFKWKRTKPMRFFFRIFTTAKIQPIKIISTSSMGGKQLQVVPAKPNSTTQAQTHTLQSTDTKSETTKETLSKADADAQNYRNKERLMANLELQSKTKVMEKPIQDASWKHHEKTIKQEHPKLEPQEEPDCVYEYEEPDKDEIRAFAEKRDREWALQKQLDEEKEKHRTSKKRKKSKHSKNNLLYKKRKLHAEITSSESLQKEESLKLKVKLTPHNGYKHKHHKSSQSQAVEQSPKVPELSSKEKLLQMRQVRHKHIASLDDKSKALYQNNNSSPAANTTDEIIEKSSTKNKEEIKSPNNNKLDESNPKVSLKLSEPNVKAVEIQKKQPEVQKKQPELPETQNKATQSIQSSSKPLENSKTLPSSARVLENSKPAVKESLPSVKTLRSDFAIKTNATKELCMQKYPTVQLERNEQTERQAQKTFLKTFQSYTEKLAQSTDKNQPTPKIARPVPQNTYPGRSQHNHIQASKSLEQKIANLHQQCTTVEAKQVVRQESSKLEKKFNYVNEKPQVLNSQYPSGFTVSKVEAGVKRKSGNEHESHDKRPSLEITLINPPVDKSNSVPEYKPPAKRPPPPTIPLERIKKSMNRISGVSIIPKIPERCDNTGALDLSKPSKSLEVTPKISEIHNKLLNGLSLLPGKPPDRVRTPDKNNQLSNLQMLSKVATEHPNINKSPTGVPNKRPPIPNLQTLKIPVPQNSSPKSNLAKLPKLNEISKTQFRMPNPQLRNMRPNQNQSVRNIPNPSLLVRQQNQNRLNSLHCNQNNSGDSKDQSTKQNSSNSESTNGQKMENKEKSNGEEKGQKSVETEVKVGS